ncbi:MAG: RagB/SusD family nutrient uptake outer membrane protein [Tannerellaceae bacterium]|nr:RagB/SusD family nutrient uptake outer membrane protein [Tannerellaceae bacterium]
MKTVTKYTALFISALFLFSACLGDLDTIPLDERTLSNEDVYSTKEGYMGALAKCYASLVLTGQQGPSGDPDISKELVDEGYSGLVRLLFYVQVASTDEVNFTTATGHGGRTLLQHNWDASTQITGYPYYRLFIAIKYCNEFLVESEEDLLKSRGVYDALKDEIGYLRSEARMIRAYCYSMLCDLYGDVPFVDETMPNQTIPGQITRKEVFEYVISELKDIDNQLKPAGTQEYGRVDQVAAWFLLARMYLNAEIYIGENKAQESYEYAKKIIDSNTYPLASDYRHIFLADNNTCPEIIWPLEHDATNIHTESGSNFLMKAFLSPTTRSYINSGINNDWNGNANAKRSLVILFNEEDRLFKVDDPEGNTKADKRAQFFSGGREDDEASQHTIETWVDGADYPANYLYGYAPIKWRNVTKDGQELTEGGTVYAAIDFPLFRTADAYLMAAEAILRGANGYNKTEAVGYVNEIRDRAYMYGKYETAGVTPVNGRITEAELTLDFLCEERSRELHMEIMRRTDLIRFGKYTQGYNWDWKGSSTMVADGSQYGKDIDNKYNLFPIPAAEFTSNPNLKQNPDYQ